MRYNISLCVLLTKLEIKCIIKIVSYFVVYLCIISLINERMMEYIFIKRQNKQLKFTFRDVKIYSTNC